MTDELVVVRNLATSDQARERFAYCGSCGTEHLQPVPCGMRYRDRLATVQVSEQGFDTAEKHRYFDSSALDEAFGPDRREQMLHETRGLGPVRTADDGTPWVYDDPDTGEMRPMERSDVIGGYLRGTPESELDEDA
jgi:hypothetical protein